MGRDVVDVTTTGYINSRPSAKHYAFCAVSETKDRRVSKAYKTLPQLGLAGTEKENGALTVSILINVVFNFRYFLLYNLHKVYSSVNFIYRFTQNFFINNLLFKILLLSMGDHSNSFFFFNTNRLKVNSKIIFFSFPVVVYEEFLNLDGFSSFKTFDDLKILN